MGSGRRFFYATVIFLSSFLIFQIQPIISKYILPWFGGTASVWTVCMLFFQTMLFAGYLYAHLLTVRSRIRTQVIVHGTLVAIAAIIVLCSTIIPSTSLKPETGTTPFVRILIILMTSIGLPYFTLASTSPLLQFWHSQMQTNKEPYFLYAISNVASLAALLTYPPLVEPVFSLHVQSRLWSIGFGLFATVYSVLMWFFVLRIKDTALKDALSEEIQTSCGNRQTDCPDQGSPIHSEITELPSFDPQETASSDLIRSFEQPHGQPYSLWFLLPMVASMLLLAITNQLCTDVASSPFLWILPLSIYLITFIVAFSGWQGLYRRSISFVIVAAGMLLIIYNLKNPGHFSLLAQTLIYSFILYSGCTAAHTELYRVRPQHLQLTRYYTLISAGGAAGTIFVAMVAPVVFSDYYEFHLSCVALLMLLIACAYHEQSFPVVRTVRSVLTRTLAYLLLIAVIVASIDQILNSINGMSEIRRNFFGVVSVYQKYRAQPAKAQFRMSHGTTLHGLQFVDSAASEQATSYYATTSGIGLALNEFPGDSNLTVGVVGLGTGTIAVYGQRGDAYRFYEINPEVITLAQNTRYFTYLSKALQRGVDVRLTVGDARLSMEMEVAAGIHSFYDVLVIDAFSSDAIPTHLLTTEAFTLYFQLLKKNGVLAVHTTNRHVDLTQLIFAVAATFDYHPIYIESEPVPDKSIMVSDWILLTNNPFFVKNYFTPDSLASSRKHPIRLWTDDFSSVWDVLRK
ncbi:MAG: hypothetical protein JW795_09230 [Chitinivibrionales bacterium]|nr:hypothetical protein [Chitinivibrionales bacterium]